MIRILVQWVINNGWYKLAAIAIAILLWAIVQGDEVVEYNRRIKVIFDVPDGYAIRDGNVRDLQATIRVPKILASSFINRPIEARIQIPENQTGSLDIPFDKEYIRNWDHRVRVNVKESFINIYVDKKMTREIKIREVLVGTPLEGFFVQRADIKPDKVKITGIKADIENLEEVMTEPINIAKIDRTKTYLSAIETKPFGTDAFSQSNIEVTVHLTAAPVNKKFSSIPVEAVGSPYSVNVRPQFVSVIVQGSSGTLEYAKTSDFRAFVDLSNLQPGRYDRTVQIKIPSDTVLIETFPEKVRVDISSN